MEPQQPINPTEQTVTKSGMSKVLLIIIILALIAVVAYMLFSNKTEAPATSDALANQQAASELSQIEQENNNEDFSQIEADFGAEVNAAAQ